MQRRFKRPWDWLIVQAASVGDLRQQADNPSIDIALISSQLPGGEPQEGLGMMLSRRPDLPCIAVVEALSESTPEAWSRHPISVITRPLPSDLPAMIRTAIELRRPEALRQFQRDEESIFLHGTHPAIEKAREQVQVLGPGWEPIHIVGEAGTGREHLARALHAAERKSRPFVYLYCGGWSADAFRRLLHGSPNRPGLIERTSCGTLYLDQAALLSPESRREITQLMDSESPIRLIASTDSSQDMRAVFGGGWTPIHLPPIRERTEDLEELLSRLLVDLQWELGRFNLRRIAPDALDRIRSFPFSTDNLTEIRRMLVWHALENPDQETLHGDDLPVWMQAWSQLQH
jgi:DNA-binding NtrC family response regulator